MFKKALKVNRKYELAFRNVDLDKEEHSAELENTQTYSVENLLELLQKGNWEEKKMAIAVLSSQRYPGVSETLIRILKKNDNISKIAVIRILGNLKIRESINYLIDMIHKSQWGVREEIAYALGMIGDNSALKTLHDLLLKDKDHHVRKAAVMALYRINSPESMNYFEAALNDKIPAIKDFVLWVLANRYDSSGYYKELYLKKHKKEKRKPVRITSESNTYILEDVNDLVKNRKWDKVIGKGENAIEALTSVIKNQDMDYLLEAIIAIGDIGSPKGMDILAQQIDHSNADVRVYIAEAFEKIGSRKSIPLLIDLLSDPEWNVRYQASQGLSTITGEFFGEDKNQWYKWWEKNH